MQNRRIFTSVLKPLFCLVYYIKVKYFLMGNLPTFIRKYISYSKLHCLVSKKKVSQSVNKTVCCWNVRCAQTHGLRLRLYGGLDTINWLRAETTMRMRMGINWTNRARLPWLRKNNREESVKHCLVVNQSLN